MESQEQLESGVTMTDYLTDMLKEEEIMKNILAKGNQFMYRASLKYYLFR